MKTLVHRLRDKKLSLSCSKSVEIGVGASSLPPNHKAKCWKVRKEKWRMVVGVDVNMGEIPYLLGQTAVGRFSRKVVNASTLVGWMDSNWSSLLGYKPIFHNLSRG
jgi:hypothetical protein